MERIVIEVSDEIAKKWQNASPEIKRQFEKSFERQIDLLLREIQKAEFKTLLDKISEQAAKNGLTEEILQQLLNEE